MAILIIKVSGPNLVTRLEMTPIVEWCVIRFKSKNKHQKKMSSKEIRPCTCNLLTMPGSIVIINWGCGARGTYTIIL